VSLPILLTDMSQTDFHDSAAGFIISGLEDIIQKYGRASLFLSGGSTPGPVYEKLSETDCSWNKINIGLVDERWVDESDKGSNAALIHRTLLKNAAKAAAFMPMKTRHGTPQLGARAAQKKYQTIFNTPAVAVLGMGTDGHICSWFPGASGLTDAIDPKNKHIIQAITASPTKVTGSYLNRITLTLSALERCEKIGLLISGRDKKSVLEKAMQSTDMVFPVSHLLNMAKTKPVNPLTILHAA